MNPLSGPVQVFHVGRPDQELPHQSMERCDKFHKNNPESKLVVFLWDEKDVIEFTAKKQSNCEVVHWRDDSELMNWLMDRIATIVGTRIVWPQWFVCPEKHVTAFNYEKGVEKCETCGAAVVVVQPHEKHLKRFTEVFTKVISLVNFDTTSGTYLHLAVNPTANVLRNMPAALGCRHVKAVDLRGKEKGKPILLCAAGPSLDMAIPHLKRLQDKCVISCVARVWKKLKKAGIRVRYTVSVEMFDWDSHVFDGVTNNETYGTTLVFATVCAPATVEKWPGERYCLWDIETAKIFGRDDYILGGNSVAHHQLNFAAQILGCEPLILVGNDLAYTEPRTHALDASPDTWPDEVKAKDAAFHGEEKWVPCTGKGDVFHPECHRTPVFLEQGAMAPSRLIEVRSSKPYECFADLFSMLIAKHKKPVLNACPNGQKIHGTEYVDLSTFDP